MYDGPMVKLTQSQFDTLVHAHGLLVSVTGSKRTLGETVDAICGYFIARHTPPEDMTNIVPFERDAKQRQPNR